MSTPPPVPRLRRDPSPSQVNGRRVLIGALVFFLLLVTFVIVLVLTIGLNNHGVKIPPGPKPHATPSPPIAAPAQIFGIVPTGIVDVAVGRRWVSTRTRAPVVALGISPNDHIAYSTSAASGCRTMVQETFFPPPSSVGNGIDEGGVSRTVATVDLGQVYRSGPNVVTAPPTPIAVSPDGASVAFVTDRAPDPATGRCTLSEHLVVLDLRSHQVRSWIAPRQDTLLDLAWSPDGRQLAYLIAPACQFLPSYPSTCFSAASGTRVLTLTDAHADLASVPRVLPLIGRGQGDPYGPVFWWHGQQVAVFKGVLRSLNGRGGLGPVRAAGLPSTGEIDSVSSDPSGENLLMTDEGTTYRWDRGALSKVNGAWTQPGW